jgi:fibro-slime domain-containing protein
MSHLKFAASFGCTGLVVSLALSACGTKNGVEDSGAGGAGYQTGSGGSGPLYGNLGGDGSTTGGATGVAPAMPWPPSTDYVNVTNVTFGAYALGPDLSNGMPENTAVTCNGMLFGVVRDFKMGNATGGHPDFETAPDSTAQNGVQGIVATTLGDDGKPVYANPTDTQAGIASQESFDQWYRDTADVNISYIVALKLTTTNGISTFSASVKNGSGQPDSSFFPLDGAGFDNEGQVHNFAFTTEIHTSFVYKGDETFTFKGDDDVWVFINKQLVIDLGGRHGQLTGSVALKDLNLTAGETYPLDVFNAERHTSQSNFRIDTSLTLADCGRIDGIIIN